MKSREEILEILNKDHVYYGPNKLSISALYDWEDVKENFKDRKQIEPCSWAICKETDPLPEDEYGRSITLHIPMDYFNTKEEAVDKFLEGIC